MTKTLLTVLLLMVFAGAYPVSAQNKTQTPAVSAADVLRLINEHRTGMGLEPLKMTEVISKAAEKHSHNMASKKIPFGHDGFDARMAGLRKQIKNTDGWAENVAYGAETAEAVVDMWLHSPGHKKNIEGNYNLTGLGIVKGADGELYYTQIFVHD